MQMTRLKETPNPELNGTMDDDGPFHSSGNVFADFGYPDPELALAKSNLAIEILQIIRKRKLTQTQAAELMGIKQPRVSNIVRGRLAEISLESLMEYLSRLGSTVEITVTTPAEASGERVSSHTFTYGSSTPSRELVHAVGEEGGSYEAEPEG